MRRIYLTVAVAAVALLVTSSAMAQNYGRAGCGLGSMAFDEDTGFKQVLAATTNGSFGSQTFGISSGTSNCSKASGDMASAKAFVEANRETIAKDISRASGETIVNLSTLAGCADAQAVGQTLQKEYSNIFTSAQMKDTHVSDNVVRTLQAHKELACGNLS